MPRLTPADEYFYHQIPEPLSHVMVQHPHWRESLFFVAHPRQGEGDVLVLTMATFPEREHLDSLQMGRIDGQLIMARHERSGAQDPHTLAVGPVSVEVIEPFKTLHLRVTGAQAPVELDLRFEARTRAHGLRRGTMKRRSEIIWDQSHMIQSGTFNGTYTRQGVTRPVTDWWGQRDHSWGIRNHARCPCWMWLAFQFPTGMLGVWHWEFANGAPVYTDGCFAPADQGPVVRVRRFEHRVNWLDDAGAPTDYGRDGASVAGLSGEFDLVFEDGRRWLIRGQGRWHSRYGALGGGQQLLHLVTDDGQEGNGVCEITGAHHHQLFPVARGELLPGEE